MCEKRHKSQYRDVTTQTPEAPAAPSMPQRHSVLEDVVGLVTGAVLVSLGLFLLDSAHLVTGGTAGLSLLIGYASGMPYPVTFVLVNLPFFIAAIRRKGWDFTLRTVIVIASVSGLSALYTLPGVLGGLELDPVFAAVVANLLVGVGVLIIFRHRASLGGFNIAAIIVQERTGFSAGYTLMILDGLVVASSLFVVEPYLVLLSVLGAVVLNGSLVLNHKPGRYLGA